MIIKDCNQQNINRAMILLALSLEFYSGKILEYSFYNLHACNFPGKNELFHKYFLRFYFLDQRFSLFLSDTLIRVL